MSSSEIKQSTRENARYHGFRDLTISYEGSHQDIPVRVPDISVNGMFVNTAHYFPEGSILKLSFRLARSNYPIEARGEVRYCLQGVGVGIQFTDLSDEAKTAIEQELSETASVALP
jgi:PilZ domain